MEFELGTIKVEAQLLNEEQEKVESLQDVSLRYNTLGYEQKEHFYALFLDAGNNVLGDKLLGLGDESSAPADQKDLVRTAALVNAAAVILVHNHPSSNPDPTQQDIEITQKIHDLLDKINVQLLDHVIISRNQNHSMKRKNNGPF